MARYVIKRVLLGIVAIVGVSIVIFVATRLSGDVTYIMLPETASKADIAALRASLGLDKPIIIQYFIFIQHAITGDFGISLMYKVPTMGLVAAFIPASIELAAIAILITIILGVLVGVLSASRRGKWIDRGGTLFALFGQSMPSFWLGIMLILIFSVWLGWLPTSGSGGIRYIIMPAITLGWYSTAAVMRLTRSGMIDVLDNEYIRLARLKGNPEHAVIWKHALRNALIPVITMSGIQLAYLVGGAVVVETVFAWPGLGKLIMDGITHLDYPLVQAGVFITSTIFVVCNLIVDLLYSVIDPRISYK
jgi:peptide/nickel transport system permease protein